jgi:hypothetical protein
MSARREKRLRKLEATVTYMDGRVRALEKRVIVLEELAASPTMILSTEEKTSRPCGFLASLLLKLRGKRGENSTTSMEQIKSHPPRPFS